MKGTLVSPAVKALMRKELREYRNHRMILISAILLPLAFLFLPMVALVALPADATPTKINLAVGQAIFCFFLTPIIIPATMAAFSVIGERDQGTLEPVLTLPLTDRQFLAGKMAPIVSAATLMAWGVYAGYMLFAALLVHGPARAAAMDPTWTVGILAMAPALALFSTLVGMTISARARDIRVAEHMSGLVLFPGLAPILLIASRTVPVNLLTWAVFFTVVASLDATLMALALRLFVRERALAAT
jgi:ABC-2 type transport system permease protein